MISRFLKRDSLIMEVKNVAMCRFGICNDRHDCAFTMWNTEYVRDLFFLFARARARIHTRAHTIAGSAVNEFPAKCLTRRNARVFL